MTYAEYRAQVQTLPQVFSSCPNVGILTADGYLSARFGGRDCFTDSVSEFTGKLSQYGNEAKELYADRIAKMSTLISEYMADEETETVDNKAAPAGSTDFSSVYSLGGTVRTRKGGDTGSPDRVRAMRDDFRTLVVEMYDYLEPLFVGVW